VKRHATPSEIAQEALDLYTVARNAARGCNYGERASDNWLARWRPAEGPRAHLTLECLDPEQPLEDLVLTFALRGFSILKSEYGQLHLLIPSIPVTVPSTDAAGNPTLIDYFALGREIVRAHAQYTQGASR